MGYDLKIGDEIFEGIEKIRIFDNDGQMRTFRSPNLTSTNLKCACGVTIPDGDFDITVTGLNFSPRGFAIMLVSTLEDKLDQEGEDNKDIVGKASETEGGSMFYAVYAPKDLDDEGNALNLWLRAIGTTNALTMRLNPNSSTVFQLNDDGFHLESSSTNIYKQVKGERYFWIAWG